MPRFADLHSTRLRQAAALIASLVILATAGPAIAVDPAAEPARPVERWTLVSSSRVAPARTPRLPGDGVGADQRIEAYRRPTPVKVAPKAPAPVRKLVTAKAAKHPTLLASRYVGRNHMWMPALGINRTVYWFSCSRTRPPDNYVYRWGCAGRNNVYLLGHAWGVFKPLHDAYVQGRLRVGMEVIYADGAGRVRHYRIVSWRVVSPTVSNWIGSFSRPTMILQTCVGSRSQYRLNVKLVATT